MSFYYIKQGYALVATNGAETGHWFGGKTEHDGAICPGCKNPLLLLADIDCTQLRTHVIAKLFQTIDRLPLFYCWRCDGAVISYSIVDSKRIKILKHEGEKGDSDFPYGNYPISFPRRPISLIPIDYSLAKLLAIYQEVDEDWLSEEDSKIIEDGIKKLRHQKFSFREVNRHQIGGLLRLVQKHQEIGCPNTNCESHKNFFKRFISSDYMRELAVICNDPISGLPMVDPIDPFEDQQKTWNEFVQVVFYICPECLAITAQNQCD
jgi:hypothetical protein